MAKKKSIHYVDNKQFLQAMIDWRESCEVAETSGKITPPVTNYIGECFLKIATHLAYRPNFINYTYRDEMVSDGIENCLQYVKNKMIEREAYTSFTTMEGDNTRYQIDGLNLSTFLPEEDVYKPKKKEPAKKKGLEIFMEKDT